MRSERPAFRARAVAHKRERTVHLGEHVTLLFEDELTIRYQIQEMLRVEKMFEEEGIQGRARRLQPADSRRQQLKATMLIEYEDEHARREALARLKGIEDRVWLRVGAHPAVHPIADEDLERENAEKTSSVHFLRFELTPPMIADFKAGAEVAMGVDHPAYQARESLSAPVRKALAADFA